MSRNTWLVPGYAVRPERYGPDVFRNVAGIGWSDQQGFSQAWGTTFRGRQGISNWFHFPITSPTIFQDIRLRCNLAAVTLNLQASNAFLKAMHVWDRTNRFFVSPDLNETGDFGSVFNLGHNAFEFPDHVVDGAIGISVLIFFNSDSDVTFTGAGAQFHD